MKNKEIEKYLHSAVNHSVPDVLDRILSGCEGEQGKVIEMTQKKNHIKKWIAAAAAVVLVVLAGTAVGIGAYNQVDSIIALDVNPSVSLKINRNERVLEASAGNGDGELILKDMDLKNTDLDVAVNAIIGSLLKNGFIDELSNSILVSVEGENIEKCGALKQRLAEEIDNLLRSNLVKGSILSQVVPEDNEQLRQIAEEYDISIGKAALVQKIVKKNPALKLVELVKMPINDLNLLAEAGTGSLEDITVSGSASDKAYIGEEKAKQAAFERAGVKQADVSRLEVELDCENHTMVYDVEFYSKGKEYEIAVDALSGKILLYDVESDDNKDKNDGKDDGDEESDQDKENKNTNNQSSNGGEASSRPASSVVSHKDHDDDDRDDKDDDATPPSSTVVSYIGLQKAKDIALRHAGASPGSAKKMEGEFETGRTPHYDVSFVFDGYEYDYEIDAANGKILDSEKEKTKETAQNVSNNSTLQLIGEKRAKEIALANAGLSTGTVRELECELERGRIAIYEITFIYEGTEYQYEIDAYNGNIRDFEKEKDD